MENIEIKGNRGTTNVNSLSAKSTKRSNTQTIRCQRPTNCLSVFNHLVGLALKGG